MQKHMRWYKPSLGDFEWREVPLSDEEALSLLESYPDAHLHAEIYQEWRELGASFVSALIGQARRPRESGKRAEPIG